jgi:hypothetical protein
MYARQGILFNFTDSGEQVIESIKMALFLIKEGAINVSIKLTF